MVHVGLLVVLAIGVPPPAAAAAPTAPLWADSILVDPRPVPQSLLSFQDDPAFRYEVGREPRPGLLSRLWDWIVATLLVPLFGRVSPTAARFVLYALLAVVLGSALYHVLKARPGGAVARTIRSDLDRALVEDGIEQVDLESWLQRALREGRNREAVRLHYLIALQLLAARGELSWTPEKTNSAYVRELGGRPVQERFARFTRMFDAIWYGSGAAGPAEVDLAREHVGAIRSDSPADAAAL